MTTHRSVTDGLALVAYAATHRLDRREARYAWTVVIVAAGLSGFAQAVYLASGEAVATSTVLRLGVGAWPAIAATIAAHLLYLLGRVGCAIGDTPIEVRPEPQPPAPTGGNAAQAREEGDVFVSPGDRRPLRTIRTHGTKAQRPASVRPPEPERSVPAFTSDETSDRPP